jgi:hypothetical protein
LLTNDKKSLFNPNFAIDYQQSSTNHVIVGTILLISIAKSGFKSQYSFRQRDAHHTVYYLLRLKFPLTYLDYAKPPPQRY